ncbi:MAG: tRNA (adenosine(37)-N6)-threonylcarbamoyltransferase complex ATPase subunit type 1 TsaE [Desulfotignum sp.]|nr:tRNA (adenosine(37)-N6)-threonylcarbamoyltransferase complex ATPase subunit type 1 TsaE [Desulfotignum sp.]MCF8112386.1 tRNA (adenosine(37)-N6)-threonylcarbamoyltransferase complex ATPase subunit type 1 TsaE [Desulfotignum sp.]MCF8125156.1 tRNA (adenosine(37)-N6)-threonylcarbamoyltransferase complex ATPase subunit type 1 TsaE [Desulfotignum sp.]
MKHQVITKTDDQTRNLGHRLGQAVTGPVAIALTGDLGCGKTTFVKGLARGLGVNARYPVTSPTFTIINEYPAAKNLRLCHLDLYRLGSAEELAYTGFDDLADAWAVIVVEWPDLLKEDRFAFDLELKFSFDSDYHRVISFFVYGQTGANMLSKLFS